MKYLSEELKNKATNADLRLVKRDLIESTDLKTDTLSDNLKRYCLKSDMQALKQTLEDFINESEFKHQTALSKIDTASKLTTETLTNMLTD